MKTFSKLLAMCLGALTVGATTFLLRSDIQPPLHEFASASTGFQAFHSPDDGLIPLASIKHCSPSNGCYVHGCQCQPPPSVLHSMVETMQSAIRTNEEEMATSPDGPQWQYRVAHLSLCNELTSMYLESFMTTYVVLHCPGGLMDAKYTYAKPTGWIIEHGGWALTVCLSPDELREYARIEEERQAMVAKAELVGQ